MVFAFVMQSTALGFIGHILTHKPQFTHFSALIAGRGNKDDSDRINDSLTLKRPFRSPVYLKFPDNKTLQGPQYFQYLLQDRYRRQSHP